MADTGRDRGGLGPGRGDGGWGPLGVFMGMLIGGPGLIFGVRTVGQSLPDVVTTLVSVVGLALGAIGLLGSIIVGGQQMIKPVGRLADWLRSHWHWSRRRAIVASIPVVVVAVLVGVVVDRSVFPPSQIHDLPYVENVLYVGSDNHIHDVSGDATGKGGVGWRDTDLTKAVGKGDLVSGNALAGFVSDGLEHAVYLNGQQHVSELVGGGGGWRLDDLNALANAPRAVAGSSLAVYATSDEQDVLYVGSDGNVRDLHWDRTAWAVVDLAATGAAVSAAPDTSIAVYAIEGKLKVAYLDSNHHVRQLVRDSQGWHEQDLTLVASAVAAGADSRLAAYVRDDVESIVYLDDQGDVRQLRGDTSGWRGYDLTTAANASSAGHGSPLTAYVVQSTPKILYITSGGNVQELWADANAWHLLDLTEVANAPQAGTGGLATFSQDWLEHVTLLDKKGDLTEVTHVTGSDMGWRPRSLTALAHAVHANSASPVSDVVLGDTQTVVYFGGDGHARDLQWEWRAGAIDSKFSVDVTTAARTAAVGRAGSLVSSRLGNAQHVFYVASDGHVHGLHLIPVGAGSVAWRDEDITMTVGAVPPAVGSHLTGYVIGVSQHLVYIDARGHARELWAEWSGKDWMGWHQNDLTLHAHTAAVSPGSALSSCVVTNDIAHVIVVGGAGHLLDLSYTSGRSSDWKADDLTALVGGVVASPETSLTASVLDGAVYVEYQDSSGHLNELQRDPADGPFMKTASKGWHPRTDLMTSTGALPAGERSGVAAIRIGRTRHVIYVDRHRHVNDLSNDGSGWQTANIASRAGAPPAGPDTALVASGVDGVEQVLYRDSKGGVLELIGETNGGWKIVNVTAALGAPDAASWSGLTGVPPQI